MIHKPYSDTYLADLHRAQTFIYEFDNVKKFSILLARSFYDFWLNDGDEYNVSSVVEFPYTIEGAKQALTFFLGQRESLLNYYAKRVNDTAVFRTDNYISDEHDEVFAKIQTPDGDVVEAVVYFPQIQECERKLVEVQYPNGISEVSNLATVHHYGFPELYLTEDDLLWNDLDPAPSPLL